MVQSSVDIDKEPRENSKRDSALTLLSYVFPSNSSSKSSPWSTNITENQICHTVGCQRVRSNKKTGRKASLLSSTKSARLILTFILCVSSYPGNLLIAPVYRWGWHSYIKAGWPFPCCLCTQPLLFPFFCGIFSIRNFHSPWPLFSHFWLSDTRLLFHLEPKDEQEGKQTEGTSSTS